MNIVDSLKYRERVDKAIDMLRLKGLFATLRGYYEDGTAQIIIYGAREVHYALGPATQTMTPAQMAEEVLEKAIDAVDAWVKETGQW